MLSNLFSKKSSASIQWNHLSDVSQFEQMDEMSNDQPVLIFKHSTRCPISTMSLGRFERSFIEETSFRPYFVDLISNREVSNEIARRYDVMHESPQAILLSKGKAVYNASHNGIDFHEIEEKAKQLV